jgi:hypothetical protein
MDHHDDWADWSEEPADFPDADTADLGGHDVSDLGHPDDLGHPEDPAHDGFDAADAEPLAQPGPDLLHDGDDNLALDPSHDDDLHPSDDAALHSSESALSDDGVHGHETLGEAGHESDQPAFADPDAPVDHDPGSYDGDFPPPLDLGHAPPEPMDGYPWSDPATLGEPSGVTDAVGSGVADQFGFAAAPHPDDLFAYAGLQPPGGGDVWSALLGADDPATSALARWWGPAT